MMSIIIYADKKKHEFNVIYNTHMSLIVNIYYTDEGDNAKKFAEEMASSGIFCHRQAWIAAIIGVLNYKNCFCAHLVAAKNLLFASINIDAVVAKALYNLIRN